MMPGRLRFLDEADSCRGGGGGVVMMLQQRQEFPCLWHMPSAST